MPLLDGFEDADLHPQIVQALKVLTGKQQEHQQALASVDQQYLKPLKAAHDGDSPDCLSVLAQVAAVTARLS